MDQDVLKPEEILSVILAYSAGQMYSANNVADKGALTSCSMASGLSYDVLEKILRGPDGRVPRLQFCEDQWYWASSLTFLDTVDRVLMSFKYGLGMMTAFSIVSDMELLQHVNMWSDAIRQFWSDELHQVEMVKKRLLRAKEFGHGNQKQVFNIYASNERGLSGILSIWPETTDMLAIMPAAADMVRRSRMEEYSFVNKSNEAVASTKIPELAEEAADLDGDSEGSEPTD